ncbi:MAG: hypothetical protein ACI4QJ_05905 [Candidatus Spyradenecus sp.]
MNPQQTSEGPTPVFMPPAPEAGAPIKEAPPSSIFERTEPAAIEGSEHGKYRGKSFKVLSLIGIGALVICSLTMMSCISTLTSPSIPPPPSVECVFGAIRSAVSKKPSVARMAPESNFYKVYFMEERSSRLSSKDLEIIRASFAISPSNRITLKPGPGNHCYCCYWFWVDNHENPKLLCIIAEPLNGDRPKWHYYLGPCRKTTTIMMQQDYAELSEAEVKEVQKWLRQDPIDESKIFALLHPTTRDASTRPKVSSERLERGKAFSADGKKNGGQQNEEASQGPNLSRYPDMAPTPGVQAKDHVAIVSARRGCSDDSVNAL